MTCVLTGDIHHRCKHPSFALIARELLHITLVKHVASRGQHVCTSAPLDVCLLAMRPQLVRPSDAFERRVAPRCPHQARLLASPCVNAQVAKNASSSVSPGHAFLPGQSCHTFGSHVTLPARSRYLTLRELCAASTCCTHRDGRNHKGCKWPCCSGAPLGRKACPGPASGCRLRSRPWRGSRCRGRAGPRPP